MKLSEHLDERFIALELKSSSRDEAVRELAGLLKGSPDVADFDQYLADVFAREAEGSTGVGLGAAIPHSRTDAVKEFVVAVGRAPKGIDFNSVDGKPVKVVVLMGTPKDKVQLYLQLLAHLSHLLKTDGFLDSLLDAPDAAAIVELFRSNER